MAPCPLGIGNGTSPERHLERDGSCGTNSLDDTCVVNVEETLLGDLSDRTSAILLTNFCARTMTSDIRGSKGENGRDVGTSLTYRDSHRFLHALYSKQGLEQNVGTRDYLFLRQFVGFEVP